MDLPNIPTGVHSLLVHKMATCSSAVSVLVRKLGVRPTSGKRFCLVQHNRRTKGGSRLLTHTTVPCLLHHTHTRARTHTLSSFPSLTVTRVLKATALLLRVQATWGEEPCQFVLKELPVSREQEERCAGCVVEATPVLFISPLCLCRLSVMEAKSDEHIWKRKVRC